MEKGSLEIFKSPYGYYNFRITDGKPSEELVTYLKGNGYRWSRNNNCWYPATSDAKEKNLHDDFVMKFQERFFDNGTKEQIEDRNVSEQIENDVVSEKITQLEEKKVQLQALIDELLAERKRDKEKIAQLEFEVANSRASDEQEAFYTQQEQQQLDEESEWERENSLTADEEAAIVAESHAEEEPHAVSGAMQRRMFEEIVEAEAREEEPAAEKQFLQAQEHPERTAQPESDSVEVSPEELSGAKQMLPTAQYVTTLRFSQGEEGDFFKRQIKDIAAAVKNADQRGLLMQGVDIAVLAVVGRLRLRKGKQEVGQRDHAVRTLRHGYSPASSPEGSPASASAGSSVSCGSRSSASTRPSRS